MACKERAAKVGGGVLGRAWALVAALALLLGLAAFAPAPAQAASFRDVPSGQWYTSWVDQASDRGLMSGFTDPATGRPTGYFGPDEPLTRAQVATVLWRMAGGPSSGHASFPDVERGSWYDAPVAWCVKAGVVTGYTSGPDKGHFRPDRPVTRQELATMVWRYAKYAGMDVADPDPAAFRSTTDWRTADSWASEALTWTAAAGVLSGVDNHDGTYSVVPFGTATRAMAAKVFVVLSGSPSAAKASYTVTFDSNGGSAVKAQTVKSGAKASKPADPTKEGYEFAGWYSDKSLTKAFNFNSTVKSNLTLYAKWEANKYTVTFVSNGGSSVAKQAVAYGARASKPADPTLDDSQFVGWYADAACTEAYDFSLPVKANLTLYAKWEARTQFYAVLYKDGLLSLQDGSDEDPSRDELLGKWKWDGSSRPWYDKRAYVKAVVVRDQITVFDGSSLFSGLSNCRNIVLGKLDVSQARSLSYMFSGCSSLYSLDLSGWDTSSVSDFSWMFDGCLSLRTLDVSDWDTSSAVGLSGVFSGCSSLQSLDVSGWDVSGATDLSRMFSGCSSLRSLDVSGWDVSGATDLSWMFEGCSFLATLDVSSWDVSGITSLSATFYGCSSLQSLDVSGWDTSAASGLNSTFSGCSSLQSLDVSRWDTSAASGFSATFYGCSSLRSLDVSGWDTSSAVDLSHMFSGCSSLATLDVSGWDVSSVLYLSYTFSGCSSLQHLDVSGWDTSSAVDLSIMFSDCSSLQSLDVSGWNTSSVSGLYGMFHGCSFLRSLDLSGWDVSGARNLSDMFSGCSSLQSLNFSGWNVPNVRDVIDMFYDCPSLNSVTLGTGCGLLVEKLPYGPWYDAEGKQYERPPAGVAGTFTKTKPATLALAVDGVPDAGASLPAQIVEGEQDGLRYVVVPEGAPFECGLEYPELAGRYVGPGVYVTGYVGEADSVTVPLEIDGVPMVSANLSWNDSDRSGMTRLVAVSFERVEGKASSLVQLDVSGNLIPSLDISGLGALVRLNCEGDPIADLVQLQTWAAVEGHEARLPQVQETVPAQPATSDNAQAPSEPQEPASPDIPAEPASPEVSSAEPKEPSDPATPAEFGQPSNADVPDELDQSGASSDTGNLEQPEAPADTAELGEAGQDGDASASEEQAGAVELSELGEEALDLAA